MGLTTSHGCWDGAYSTFGQFRTILAAYAGIDLNKMEGFGGSIPFPSREDEPLVILLDHSDCDGVIEFKETKILANRMDEILTIAEKDDSKILGLGVDYFIKKLDTFIDGLLTAHAKGEDVDFH